MCLTSSVKLFITKGRKARKLANVIVTDEFGETRAGGSEGKDIFSAQMIRNKKSLEIKFTVGEACVGTTGSVVKADFHRR